LVKRQRFGSSGREGLKYEFYSLCSLEKAKGGLKRQRIPSLFF